jgi:hypothetical protein
MNIYTPANDPTAFLNLITPINLTCSFVSVFSNNYHKYGLSKYSPCIRNGGQYIILAPFGNLAVGI